MNTTRPSTDSSVASRSSWSMTSFFIFVFAMTLSSCHHYKDLFNTCSGERKEMNQTMNTLKGENEGLKEEVAVVKKANTELENENKSLRDQIEIVGQTKKVDLFFRRMCCDKTTENGADELYITVIGRMSSGGDIKLRLPDGAGHWDMNDGDQPHDNHRGDSRCLNNRSIFNTALIPGESVLLNITYHEEDGGTSKPFQDVASAILLETGDPYATAAGTIIAILTRFKVKLEDTDDVIGMFGVKISNNAGVVSVDWTNKARLRHLNPDPDDPGNSMKKEIRMNGDGADYVSWFGVSAN